MSILSRILRKRRQQSELEAFLSKLTPTTMSRATAESQDQGIRVAAAISMTVLAASQRFASRLVETAATLSRKAGSDPPPETLFDVAVWEVAAFTHYSLLAPFLELSDDTDDSAEDPYFVALSSATYFSSSLLRQHTDFGLHEDFLMNRAIHYSLRDRSVGEFEMVLGCAIGSGSPQAGLRGPLSLNLGVGLALKAVIPSFCVEMIPVLSQAAENWFQNADKLGLSDE